MHVPCSEFLSVPFSVQARRRGVRRRQVQVSVTANPWHRDRAETRPTGCADARGGAVRFRFWACVKYGRLRRDTKRAIDTRPPTALRKPTAATHQTRNVRSPSYAQSSDAGASSTPQFCSRSRPQIATPLAPSTNHGGAASALRPRCAFGAANVSRRAMQGQGGSSHLLHTVSSLTAQPQHPPHQY